MEEDLNILKKYEVLNSKTIKQALKESLKTKKISYIPYLIEPSYDLPDLSNHSTLEILKFLNHLFKSPQQFQKEIKKIGHILVKRKDLFFSFIQFIENKSFKEDSYYWYPDLEYTDIFSFICSLYEDISYFLLNYVAQQIILKKEINSKIISNFHNKINTNVSFQLGIMKKDLELLNKVKDYSPKSNLPIHSSTIFTKTIISHLYWCENVCDKFEFIHIELPVHKDREYFLCSCFSMIEVEFGEENKVTLLVSFKSFEGLLLKKEEIKMFWKEMGVIDDEWNFIIK
ncbi:hypothetical protein TUBRATIS_001530 [Tubulinosema ratisbonensis]|uniref:Uncharacterized protein n=1 Tax=Tubulinosema ratisbonensis TaxID=291195 RepID=A0A437AQ31_9MICR|nr:hypothetical protein TUBRATIS_001530 [Tubulinosema ratisbonensis]